MKFTSKFFLFLLVNVFVFSFPQPLFAQDLPKEGAVPEPAKEGPSLEIMETQIDLGTISDETEEIIGIINIFNRGTEQLEVYKVDGPCKCFSGWEGNRFLEPNEGGMLVAKFQKSKIKAGDITRMVRVRTNDPANEAAEVKFNFIVERGRLEEQLFQVQEELERVRKEVTHVRNDLKKVLEKLDIQDPHARKKKPADTTVYDINIGSSPTLGSKDAPVTIVQFSDFECVYCVREIPKLKQLLDEYPGKVRVVFKHYPLKFHKKAKPAHAAAEMALRQKGNDGFWKMHDMIFDKPKNLEISDLRGYVESMELDLAKFNKIIDEPATMNNMLQADFAEAKKCNVTGTPTIFINGQKLAGDRSLNNYKIRIDQILAAAEADKQAK